MKMIRLILALALLNQMFLSTVQAVTHLVNEAVVPESLVLDHFAVVKYLNHKGKLQTARGFIRSIGTDTLHIRNGLWRADIAYRDVAMLVMAPESQEVDQFLRQLADHKAHHKNDQKDVGIALRLFQKKTVIQMTGDQIDKGELKENRYVVVNYTQDAKPLMAFGRIRGFGGQGLIVKGDREWRIPYDAVDALTLADDKGNINRFREKGAVYDAKVLVTAPALLEKPIWGRLEQIRGDTLVVRQFRNKEQMFVPVSEIQKMEVSTGMRGRTGTGLMLGLGISAVIMTLGIVSAARDEGELAGLQVYVAGVMSVPILGICTLLGALSRTDHWVEVPTDRLDLGLRPLDPQGPKAVFSIRF